MASRQTAQPTKYTILLLEEVQQDWLKADFEANTRDKCAVDVKVLANRGGMVWVVVGGDKGAGGPRKRGEGSWDGRWR